MTFRTRVLLAFAPVVLVPLLVFGIGVRRAVRDQLWKDTPKQPPKGVPE